MKLLTTAVSYFMITEAIANMDDDGIMLQIYDNIGDELKTKNKLLEKEKERVNMACLP